VLVEPPVSPPPDADFFPQARQTIHEAFPGDEAMAAKILARALKARPATTDPELTEALIRTHQGRRQQSAALWLHTVPAFFETRSRGDPHADCSQCGGAGQVFNPELADQPVNAWIDLPDERIWVVCPRCRGQPAKVLNGRPGNGTRNAEIRDP
jgi:hypothetical protein